MAIKCHDFFSCKKPECIMFNAGEERNCWEIEPALTPCAELFSDSINMADKIIFCKNCLYFEHIN